jgi:hypothetical protein
MLLPITLITNFLALAAALWLGLYLVTRSPSRLIAWLTCFTLWSLSGHFLHVLLALLPPPVLIDVPELLAPFLQFWEANALEGATSWLQGWMIIPAVVLWHHATTLMRAGDLNRWHWTRLLIGYGLTVVAVVIQVNTSLLLSVSATGDPLYLSTLQAGALYPLFLTFGSVYIIISLANLLHPARTAPAIMPRNQWLILAAATLIAASVVPLSVLGSILGLRVPTVAVSLLLGCGVVLIGFGVPFSVVFGISFGVVFVTASAVAFSLTGSASFSVTGIVAFGIALGMAAIMAVGVTSGMAQSASLTIVLLVALAVAFVVAYAVAGGETVSVAFSVTVVVVVLAGGSRLMLYPLEWLLALARSA